MNHRHTILSFLATLGYITAIAPAAPISISITGNGAAGGLTGQTIDGSRSIYYNRIGDNSSVGDLTDTAGASTGIAVSWVAGKTGANNTVASTHPITGAPAAMFTSDSARTFLAVTTPRTSFMRWRLDGLDLDSAYDFAIFCCREGTGATSSSFTILGQNTLTGSINARGNTDQLLYLNDARPDTYGSLEMVFGFATGSTATFAYFNAFQVTERPLGAVPEPTAALLIVGSLTILTRRRRRPFAYKKYVEAADGRM